MVLEQGLLDPRDIKSHRFRTPALVLPNATTMATVFHFLFQKSHKEEAPWNVNKMFCKHLVPFLSSGDGEILFESLLSERRITLKLAHLGRGVKGGMCTRFPIDCSSVHHTLQHWNSFIPRRDCSHFKRV